MKPHPETTRLGRLPTELLVEVGKQLVDDRKLGEFEPDLKSFGDVIRPHSNATQDVRLQRLKRLYKTGERLFKAITLKLGSEGDNADPPSSRRIEAAMPVAKFQEDKGKTAFVDKILNTPNGARRMAAIHDNLDLFATTDRKRLIEGNSAFVDKILDKSSDIERMAAIHRIADNLEWFAAPDRKRLIDNVLENLSGGGSPYAHSRTFARNALAKMERHLDQAQRGQLQDVTTNNRALGTLYQLSRERQTDRENEPRFRERDDASGVSHKPQGLSLDDRIHSLRVQARAATRSGSTGDLDNLSKVAQQTNAAYEEARAALMRDRPRRGRSR